MDLRLGWGLALAAVAGGCFAAHDPMVLRAELLPQPERGAAAAPARLATLTVDQAVTLAERWHPALMRAAARVAGARGTARQAGRWNNPVLELETEDGAHNRALGFGSDAALRASLSWEPGIFGARSAEAEAAREALAARQVGAGHVRRVVEERVRRAFVRALAAEAAVRLARETLGFADNARRIAEARREAGEGSETERLRAKIEFDQAEGDLEATLAGEAAARRSLAAAIGLPGTTIERVGGALRTAWPQLTPGSVSRAALAYAPGVRTAEARLRAARASVRAADRGAWPEPGFRVGAVTARVAGDRELAVEWGVEMPLPVFDRKRGDVMAAQAGVLEAAADLTQARNDLQLSVADTTAQYTLARRALVRYQQHIVPHAESNLQLIQAGFPAQFTQLELIDAQRTLADARMAMVGRLTALAEAAVALEELTGRSLDALAEKPTKEPK